MDSVQVKTCTWCGEDKPETREFFTSSKRGINGFCSWCRVCARGHHRAWLYGEPKPPKTYKLPSTKCCRVCGEERPRTPEFWNRRKQNKDGLRGECKNCANRLDAARREGYSPKEKERIRNVRLEGYRKDPASNIAAARRWQKAHPDRVKETTRLYNLAKPEMQAARTARRRTRILQAQGSYTAADVLAKLEFQGGICYYCPADLAVTGYHVDHKIPLNGGGTNWPANICCACPTCNLRKGRRSFWEFISNS